jgi:hypothetical protein
MAILAWLAAGVTACSAPPGEDAATTDPLDVLFGDELQLCATDGDCLSSLCDRNWMGFMAEGQGYCAVMGNTLYRWQRELIALRLAGKARVDPELARRLSGRLLAEWDRSFTTSRREALILLAGELPGDSSRVLLERAMTSEGPLLAMLAGVRQAAWGGDAGATQLADAALSSHAVHRIHAARAAGRRCDELGRGILKELSEDPHPLVRDAAAQGRQGCP